jgi:hypothetical protein
MHGRILGSIEKSRIEYVNHEARTQSSFVTPPFFLFDLFKLRWTSKTRWLRNAEGQVFAEHNKLDD